MAFYYSEPSHTFSEYLLIPGYTAEDCVPANVSLRTPLTRFRKGESQGEKITLPTGFDTLFPAGLVRYGHSLSNTSALHVPALRPVRAAASDPTIHLSPDRIGQGRFFGRPVEMRRKVPLQ